MKFLLFVPLVTSISSFWSSLLPVRWIRYKRQKKKKREARLQGVCCPYNLSYVRNEVIPKAATCDDDQDDELMTNTSGQGNEVDEGNIQTPKKTHFWSRLNPAALFSRFERKRGTKVDDTIKSTQKKSSWISRLKFPRKTKSQTC